MVSRLLPFGVSSVLEIQIDGRHFANVIWDVDGSCRKLSDSSRIYIS